MWRLWKLSIGLLPIPPRAWVVGDSPLECSLESRGRVFEGRFEQLLKHLGGSFGGSFRKGVCCGFKASCVIDGVSWQYSRGGGEEKDEEEEDEKKGVCCGLRRTRHRNKRRGRAGTRKRRKRKNR